jgi:hypothetical protein
MSYSHALAWYRTRLDTVCSFHFRCVHGVLSSGAHRRLSSHHLALPSALSAFAYLSVAFSMIWLSQSHNVVRVLGVICHHGYGKSNAGTSISAGALIRCPDLWVVELRIPVPRPVSHSNEWAAI